MRIKRIIIYILLILCAVPTYALKIKKSGAVDLLAEDKRYFYQHEVSIYALPAYSRIHYADKENKQSTGGFDIGAGLDYRFFFHQNVGVSLGLQYMAYTGNYKFEAFQQTSSGIDNSDPLYPNNPYTYIQRYNVSEIAKLHYLEVPIKVLFITPSWNKVQLRTAIGLNIGYNIATTQSLSGYYDAEMIYTDNNINLDESESLMLGRYTDIAIHSPRTVLGLHVAALAEIGIGIQLSKRCQMNIDLYGSYALNNVHATTRTFIAMNDAYQGIVTTDLVGDIHPFALGARVGFSVYLGEPKEEILPPWKKRKLRGFTENLDAYSKDTFGKDTAQTKQPTEIAQETTPVPTVTKPAELAVATTTSPTIPKEVKTIVAPQPVEPAKTAVPTKAAVPSTVTTPQKAVTQVPVSQPQKATEPVHSSQPALTNRPLNAPIIFHLNSMELTTESKRMLGYIAASLLANPPKKIIVIGYTCDIGDTSYNSDLGYCRAERIRYLLQQYGLNQVHIETETRGETNPYLPNTNERNRQENRRVEMIYIY